MGRICRRGLVISGPRPARTRGARSGRQASGNRPTCVGAHDMRATARARSSAGASPDVTEPPRARRHRRPRRDPLRRARKRRTGRKRPSGTPPAPGRPPLKTRRGPGGPRPSQTRGSGSAGSGSCRWAPRPARRGTPGCAASSSGVSGTSSRSRTGILSCTRWRQRYRTKRRQQHEQADARLVPAVAVAGDAEEAAGVDEAAEDQQDEVDPRQQPRRAGRTSSAAAPAAASPAGRGAGARSRERGARREHVAHVAHGEDLERRPVARDQEQVQDRVDRHRDAPARGSG